MSSVRTDSRVARVPTAPRAEKTDNGYMVQTKRLSIVLQHETISVGDDSIGIGVADRVEISNQAAASGSPSVHQSPTAERCSPYAGRS